mgnify:CR=1 FL=1
MRDLLKEFVSFDDMIGAALIRMLYHIGLIVIVLFGLSQLVSLFAMTRFSPTIFLVGIIAVPGGMIAGFIFWRLCCELMILLYKIHDRLGEVRDRLPPAP